MTTRVITTPLSAQPTVPQQLLYDPPESSVMQMSRHTTQLTPISGDSFSYANNKKIIFKVPAQDYQDLRNSYLSMVVQYTGTDPVGDRWVEKIFRRITIRSGDSSQTIEDIHDQHLLYELISIGKYSREYAQSVQGLYAGSKATDAGTDTIPVMTGDAERFVVKLSMSGLLQAQDYLPLRWMAKLVNEGNAYSIELELADPRLIMTSGGSPGYTVTQCRYMMDLVKIPEYDSVIERALSSGQKLVIPFVSYRHHPQALKQDRQKELFTINEFAQSVKHVLVAFRRQDQIYSNTVHGTEALQIPGRTTETRGADGGVESYQFMIGNMRYPMQRVEMGGIVGQEAESMIERAKVFRTNNSFKHGDFSLIEIASGTGPTKTFSSQWFIAQNFSSQLGHSVCDADVMSGVNTVLPNVPIQMELNLTGPAPYDYAVDFYLALDHQLVISSDGIKVEY